MPQHTIPMIPDRYRDQGKWESPELFEITIYAKYVRRDVHCSVGYIDSSGECRRVQDGPVVPGPYAYLVPQATVIQSRAYKFTPPTRIRVSEGDELLLNEQWFRVVDDRRMAYPRLVPFEPVTLRD